MQHACEKCGVLVSVTLLEILDYDSTSSTVWLLNTVGREGVWFGYIWTEIGVNESLVILNVIGSYDTQWISSLDDDSFSNTTRLALLVNFQFF